MNDREVKNNKCDNYCDWLNKLLNMNVTYHFIFISFIVTTTEQILTKRGIYVTHTSKNMAGGPSYLVCLPLHYITSLFFVTGLLASVSWATLWDCLGSWGNINFWLRDWGGMIVFHGIFYICLLDNQGRKELWGCGWFDWIHKIGHSLFFWGSLIGGIGF